jgi:molybdopterin-binding protein
LCTRECGKGCDDRHNIHGARSRGTARRERRHRGRLTLGTGPNGRSLVDGRELAELAQHLAAESALATAFPTPKASARNRLTGIVTKVVKDRVMAQVELQAGPFRIVSLMSREAADELELEPGTLATASVKATTVVVESLEPIR